MKISLQWTVGHHAVSNEIPESFVPAVVPGAVQLDMAAAKEYAPYWYDDHYQDYLWMEDCYWTYRAEFAKPEGKADERCFFKSLGIDYQFEIRLNGQILLEQEGMFTPVFLDITEYLKDNNELFIMIHPVPKAMGTPGRFQARKSVKPAVSYGWDWHPRLIPAGIWDETFLEIKPDRHLTHFGMDYQLNTELSAADLVIIGEGSQLKGCQAIWRLFDPDGALVDEICDTLTDNRFDFRRPVTGLRLWWPREQGEQALYHSIIELNDSHGKKLDEQIQTIGFRQVRLLMNQGAWDEPRTFPKSRSVPPITLEINGRRLFAKGSNWVNPEIFPGKITEDRYRELLELACEANFNIIRVWGGGIVNKTAFHELCDKMGLMVWQDFPLACVDYVDEPAYLNTLKQEAVSIITRLKTHPSTVLWCGGNELFNSWSGMTDQSKALRMLNALCLEYDPETPFISTTPLMGMGHGNYVFRDLETGEEPFQAMPESECTAYTEFGMASPSSKENLKLIIPQNDLFPPKPGTSWEVHHAYHAWQGNTWLSEDIIEHYFGSAEDLETLIANGQFLQGAGYRFIYEEARRQWPNASMALNWCFNEPWPTAANNSLIEYPAKAKPSLEQVRLANRPVTTTARVPRFMWHEGELFQAEVFMHNDSPAGLAPGTLRVLLSFGDEEAELLAWRFDQINSGQNLKGPVAQCILPSMDVQWFELILEVENHPEMSSAYTFLIRESCKKEIVGSGLN